MRDSFLRSSFPPDKLIRVIILGITLIAPDPLLSQWYWQNPWPQGNGLDDVAYVGSNTFVAVGAAETVLRSTDEGLTWSVRHNMAGATHTLNGLSVTEGDILNTITLGNYFDPGDKLLRSTDGGATWFTRTVIDLEDASVSFPTADIGFLVGGGFGDGFIMKTTNGGISWTFQDNPTFNDLTDVHFQDTQLGIASGPGGAILRTTNGGAVWTIVNVPLSSSFIDVGFADATTAFALGPSGEIIKSTDAGLSWVSQNSGVTAYLSGFAAIDPSTVVVVGSGGTILKTTDGGTTWIAQVSGTTVGLNGVSFSSPDIGIVVGGGGTILRTTNGGTTWVPVSYSATTSQLNGVAFADDLIGVVVGASGTVLRTTNRGGSWVVQSAVTSNPLYDVDFGNENLGIAVGASGTVIRTADAGVTWQSVVSGTANILNDVCFVDSSLAIAVGNGRTILRSTDGGLSWEIQTPADGSVYREVSFGDSVSGTIVGDADLILHTTDRGMTWVLQSPPSAPEAINLTSVAFFNSTTGVALGYWYSFPTTFEVIARTTDGGDTWVEVNGGDVTGSMAVGEGLSVTAVSGGTIHHSGNGGLNWSSYQALFGSIIGITYSPAYDRFAVGSAGVILSTTQGVVSVEPEPIADIPTGVHLLQNYPNPFNPTTTFSFSIPQSSIVSLTMYDLLGREVATIVDEKLGPGTYTRQWDAAGLASGVYVYRLIAGDFVQTRKLVLLR